MGMDIVLRPANSSYPNAPAVERIEVGPALKKSRVGRLYGRPYPVQFRNQGAFDAWKQALGSGPEWARWGDPAATCWSIRHAIQQQLNDKRAGRHGSMEAEARVQVKRFLPHSSNTMICLRLRHFLSKKRRFSLELGAARQETVGFCMSGFQALRMRIAGL